MQRVDNLLVLTFTKIYIVIVVTLLLFCKLTIGITVTGHELINVLLNKSRRFADI